MVTFQTAVPSWTWREPPADQHAPLRVPVHPSRLRVGQDDGVFAAVEEAHLYSLKMGVDPAIDGPAVNEMTLRRFLADLARDDLAPAGDGLHLDARSFAFGTRLTAWAYTLPTRHPILDPHPVAPDDTSSSLHDWAWRAALAAHPVSRSSGQAEK